MNELQLRVEKLERQKRRLQFGRYLLQRVQPGEVARREAAAAIGRATR